MSYQLSDEDSTDSDTGIRFKTESIRNKPNNNEHCKAPPVRNRKSHNTYEERDRSSSHSRSEESHHKARDRSYSRDRRKRSSSRESRRRYHKHRSKRSPEKSSRNIHEDYKLHKEMTSKKTVKDKCKQSIDCSKISSEKEQLKRQESYIKSDTDSNSDSKSESVRKEDIDVESVRGPALPPNFKTTKTEPEMFGPALPPKQVTNKRNENSKSEEITVDFHGPSLPPHLIKFDEKSEEILNNSDKISVRSALPSQHIKSTENEEKSDEVFGPALPPHLQKSPTHEIQIESKEKIIGPSLPPHLRAKLAEVDVSNSLETEQIIISDDEDDDDMIGPLPMGHSSIKSSHTLLEERALQMKLDKLITSSGPETTVREEWMLELPEVHSVNLGLGPRQFRTKAGPDMSDRSSWTDTPKEKLKKGSSKKIAPQADIKKEAEIKRIKQRDLEQEKIVEKHKKKKKIDKSLVEMHQDTLKKKKKKEAESEKNERRPFDRDIDLKVNRFDEAQKKSVLKKAQLLDNRFSSGESKFL